ncbi:MAG: SEL1-like repeat protein [Rhodobacteraceae bacterium]|nr:SEL1-like repeat protein [Paracoccaceae bacterium]
MGIMHDRRQGVSRNHAEAVNWYEKAAKQGHLNPFCVWSAWLIFGWKIVYWPTTPIMNILVPSRTK